MTRNIDRAVERQQELDELRIREIAEQAKRSEVPATGRCHNCDEHLDGSLRWCDPDCLEDWEKRHR